MKSEPQYHHKPKARWSICPAAGLLALAVSVAAGPAEAGDCGQRSIKSATGRDGVQIDLLIPESLIERAPAWVPFEGDIPLSAFQAADLAVAWAEREYEDVDRVQYWSYDMRSYGCGAFEDRQVFLVYFALTRGGTVTRDPADFAAVLMDGTVVGPTRRPGS